MPRNDFEENNNGGKTVTGRVVRLFKVTMIIVVGVLLVPFIRAIIDGIAPSGEAEQAMFQLLPILWVIGVIIVAFGIFELDRRRTSDRNRMF